MEKEWFSKKSFCSVLQFCVYAGLKKTAKKVYVKGKLCVKAKSGLHFTSAPKHAAHFFL